MLNALILTSLLLVDPTADQVWSGFRGDGTSTSPAKNLPRTWSPTESLAWRVELPGYGQSSPVLWGNRLFLTAVEGKEKEKLLIVALDSTTGKRLWTKEFPASQKGKNNPMMSRAAPTPVVDSEGLYCLFESGDLIALTHEGAKLWHRSLTKDYGEFKNNHGLGSSLAHSARAVFALVDHAGPSYLLAVDKLTGQELWKAERPSGTAWTSPVVMTVQGKPAVLVSSSGSLELYDVANGKQLATMTGFVGNTIPSPTVCGDRIILGAGENRMKPDLAASARSNCCIRLITSSTKQSFEPVWEGKKAISQYASPLAYQGHVYFVTKTGLVHCLDLETGEERYAERLDSQCWATPIGADGHIYFFGKDGVTTVLKAGAEYEKVATNRFWSAAEFSQRASVAKEKAAATLPKPPEGKGPGGGSPLPKAELDATRYSAVGDVVYGVAVTKRAFFVRTGTEVICVQSGPPAKAGR